MLNLEVIGEGTTTKIYRDGDKAIKLYINASLPSKETEEAAGQLKESIDAITIGA